MYLHRPVKLPEATPLLKPIPVGVSKKWDRNAEGLVSRVSVQEREKTDKLIGKGICLPNAVLQNTEYIEHARAFGVDHAKSLISQSNFTYMFNPFSIGGVCLKSSANRSNFCMSQSWCPCRCSPSKLRRKQVMYFH